MDSKGINSSAYRKGSLQKDYETRGHEEITTHPDFKNGKIQFLRDLYTSVDILFFGLYQSTTVSSEMTVHAYLLVVNF